MMISFKKIIVLAMLLGISLSSFAFAAQGAPKGSSGGGSITIEQLTKGLDMLYSDRFGIVVHYSLPKGWERIEQGVDPKTGKLLEGVHKYVVLARRPMRDPKEPTDFIFELDIFEQQMDTSKLPKNATDEQIRDALGEQLTEFLNMDISGHLKQSMEMESRPRDIVAKEYRKGTFFIPVRYKTKEGAKLYTFTSFEGTTVYQLKFLVSEDMVEQHGMLIALILKNSFALTKEMHEQLLKQQPKAQP
jgi:hypothetical protein